MAIPAMLSRSCFGANARRLSLAATHRLATPGSAAAELRRPARRCNRRHFGPEFSIPVAWSKEPGKDIGDGNGTTQPRRDHLLGEGVSRILPMA